MRLTGGSTPENPMDLRGSQLLSDYAAWQWAQAGDNDEQLARLYRNLRRIRKTELTERQAEMIRLYYDEGKSIPQIAREKGVHKSTVSRTLARGRERIKRYLQYSW